MLPLPSVGRRPHPRCGGRPQPNGTVQVTVVPSPGEDSIVHLPPSSFGTLAGCCAGRSPGRPPADRFRHRSTTSRSTSLGAHARPRCGWHSACRDAFDNASPRTASRCGADVVGDQGAQGSHQLRAWAGTSGWLAARSTRFASARSGGPRCSSRRTQREDGSTDVLDGGVEVIDRGLDPAPHLRDLADPAHALETQSHGEEPLDDQVVQVPGDAVTVLEDGQTSLGRRASAAPGEPALLAPRSSPAVRASTSW